MEANPVPETATTVALRTTGPETAPCPSKMVVVIAIMVVEMVVETSQEVNSNVGPLTTIVLVVVKVQEVEEPTLGRSAPDGVGSLLQQVRHKPKR